MNMKSTKVLMVVLCGAIASLIMALLAMNSFAMASSEGPGLTADEVIQKLKEGNARFVSGTLSKANLDQKRRQEIAKGQHPYATLMGCSDSRHSLEHIFDAGLGELFVIRVAGNVSDTDELGSMEYGVDHLGTPVLLILGHTSCGAVTAVAKNESVHGHIPALVDNIIPAVKKAKENLADDASINIIIEKAIRENIFLSMADVLSKSQAIAKKVGEGKAIVIGGLYHLDTGVVEWLGEHPDQKKLITMGLAQSNHGGEHLWFANTTGMKMFFAGLSLIILAGLFYFLFISEKRLFGSLKFKARLILSFVAIIVSLLAAMVYAFDLYHSWLALVILFAIAITLSALISGAHFTAFKKFYEDAMAKVK